MHCIICLLLLAIAAKAEVKLPRLVSNGMVLQRDQNIHIWGWADVGEKISLTFKNKTYTTKASRDRRWAVNIEPQQAGGPFKMLINNIELQDLLIGDVWLCAGQSNMEAVMNRANIKENYGQIIKNSNYPLIRQFTVKKDMAFKPVQDVASDKGWVAVNPQTVLDFSAVAYFFAKDLYEKYKVPIGIINSSVGGTPAQSWVNSESLKHLPEYDKIAQKLKDTAEVSRILNAHLLKSTAWYKSIKEDDLGINEKWFLTTFHQEENWEEIQNLAQLNEKITMPKYGSMWFKTVVDVPEHLAGKAANISLGMMHTEDETYINGEKTGSINSGYTERNYAIRPGLLKAGKNTITIRLISPTTGIGFNPKNNYQLKFGNGSIPLDKPWKFRFGIETALLPRGNGLSLHSPTAYYYAMIKPLADYRIKGIVWYQGESNIPKPEEYQALLTSLIEGWRKDWQQADMPFLYVQLANYCRTPVEPTISNWALLREAQMKTLKIPHTAMVVIHDIGEKDDIHPRNKLDVGKRLALAAERLAYHENIVFSGPIYKTAKIQGDQVYVSFNHTGTGLKSSDGKLNTFEISADGKNFVAAQAKIAGKQVVVWNDTITKPVAVRYAWADSPDGANLYNNEGLPASSFKSN
ncbi:sialate O-acetylesterase [Pedobacter nyackensis]|uniref:Sialate O-acetylesterase n=2 Tax=Pedobacter nyackensis TaxID=475255 RepID=A0A1W2F2H6_9SPHI|nr:sialate O-acetylesterase [Pedobacter nyackensis]